VTLSSGSLPSPSSRRLRALVALSLSAAALGACVPASSPSPTPGPLPRIAITLPFAPLALAWAQSYGEQTGPLSFDLEVVHASVAMNGLRAGDYALAIGALQPDEGWFATPLAVDPIAVVTGGGSGVQEITSEVLAEVLAGRVADWSAVGGRAQPVQPVLPLPEDDLRRAIEAQVMRGTPFASSARLVASPAQGLSLLGEDSGAIALLPLSSLSGDAAPLRLDGLPPSAVDEYGLVARVLAIAPDEPGGPLRDWLTWIQAAGR
jgi:ABC-type phosphate transport system substrate-binding protein